MNKRPKIEINPGSGRKPRIEADPARFYDRNPSWRLAKMEFCDPFGWHVLDAATLKSVQEKLSNYETMTWREILLVAKKQNHPVPAENLDPKARKRLRDLGQLDLDELLSLRLTATQRAWGILREGVLHLLWWDPDHCVCPSIQKHT